VGVALSPLPIIAVILMLATPKARSNGPAFALGWIVGLVAVSVIVLVVAGGADDANSTASDSVNWIRLLLGLAFLSMAVKQWRKRPKKGQQAEMPKWMDAIDRFTPVRSFAIGLLLSGVNPKNLALTLAAAGSIAQAGLSTGDDAISVAIFVVLGSLTVVGPVLFFMFGGEHATKPLASIKEFMGEHNAVIMMVVLLVLGAKLIGSALPGISN
jgi:threonine/homoserine/homoserine lactone efflux protein